MRMIAAVLSAGLLGGVAEAAGTEGLVRATPDFVARAGFAPGAEVWVPAAGEAAAPGETTPYFGTQPAMSSYAGNQFRARASTLAYGSPNGAGDISYQSGDTFADARIDLPSGTILDSFRWWAIDSVAGDIGFFLIQSCLPSAGPGLPVNTVVGGTGTTGTTGNQSGVITVTPAMVVDNDTCHYWIRVSFATAGHALQKARLQWHRQVSPAPATATFNDVPTGHFAFRFVEALAASGITGGCGAGTYCPDSPVTRAQMAIFLATALGLHFPN
jgi:S-layer family protein